jgi:hypothetical protein
MHGDLSCFFDICKYIIFASIIIKIKINQLLDTINGSGFSSSHKVGLVDHSQTSRDERDISACFAKILTSGKRPNNFGYFDFENVNFGNFDFENRNFG